MEPAGVGAEVARIGDDGLTIASVILTLAVLFLSEIIPKTIGAGILEKLALPSGYILSGMTKALAHFSHLCYYSRDFYRKEESVSVTRDELHVLADISEEEGELEEDGSSYSQLTCTQRDSCEGYHDAKNSDLGL